MIFVAHPRPFIKTQYRYMLANCLPVKCEREHFLKTAIYFLLKRQVQTPTPHTPMGVLSRILILCNLIITDHSLLFILRTLPVSCVRNTNALRYYKESMQLHIQHIINKISLWSLNIKWQVREISQMSSNILDLQQYSGYDIKIENLCRALTIITQSK